MNETTARRLTLACALEAADANGTLISHDERKRFSQAALADTGAQTNASIRPNPPLTVSEEAYLVRRGELTLDLVGREHKQVLQAAKGFRWSGWLSPALILSCLLFGALMVEPGVLKRMNIMAYPLLGLIAWNLLVMVSLPLRGLVNAVLRRAPRPAIRTLIRAATSSTAERWLKGDRSSAVAVALGQYAKDWLERSLPLNAARASRLLHWSAAALAVGAIVGLYLRGIVFQFTAGWESTFLVPSHVHQILSFVLAPASLLTGIQVPDPEALATLRFGPDTPGENAARWIHLYAVTTVIFVIAPRIMLALWAHWRVSRLRERFPWPTRKDPRIRRWLHASSGQKEIVLVIPFSHTPTAQAVQALQSAAAHSIGELAEVKLTETIAYDHTTTHPHDASRSDAISDASVVILLFSLAATPEREVHVGAIQDLRSQVRYHNSATHYVVMIDEAPMRQRFEAQVELTRRLEDRRTAWRDALATTGIDVHFEDLEAAPSIERNQRLGKVIAAHATLN